MAEAKKRTRKPTTLGQRHAQKRREKLDKKSWRRHDETDTGEGSPMVAGGSRIFNTLYNRYTRSFEKIKELLPKNKKQVVHIWGIGLEYHMDGERDNPAQLTDFLSDFKDHDMTVHVLDFNAWLTRTAKKYIKNRRKDKSGREHYSKNKVQFHLADMGNIDMLPKDRPDLIIATNVAMYLEDNEVESALQATIDALKPGGLILMGGKDVKILKKQLGIKAKIPWPFHKDMGLKKLGLEHLDTTAGKGPTDFGILYRKKTERKSTRS